MSILNIYMNEYCIYINLNDKENQIYIVKLVLIIETIHRLLYNQSTDLTQSGQL